MLVVTAVVVTVGAVVGAVVASSEGALWKMLLVAVALGLPGAVAASAHPRNPVGWLLLSIACVLAGMGAAGRSSSTGSAGEWASWLVDRAGAMVVPLMFLVLVLLPDGRLPSPRWRAVVVVVTAAQVAVVLAWSLVGSPTGESNPIGVLPSSWADEVDAAGSWLLQAPLLVAVAAVVSRLRRRDDRVGLIGALVGAIGFAVLAALGHVVLPAYADAFDVLGALVLGGGLTMTLVARGGRAVPAADQPRPVAPLPGATSLSAREQEVLALVAEGLTNRQIAERLVISPVTARNHVSRILTKLDLENRTQAAAWAVGRAGHRPE